MFRQLLNRARIRVSLEPVGPLLIRSGGTSLDPDRPDLECVRTRHPVAGVTVYIPGASLKGVIRAQSERILRTLDVRCCDPLELGGKNACHRPVEEGPGETARQYAQLCAACRTFGSTRVAGRVAFADAWPWPVGSGDDIIGKGAAAANATERRTGVAIDRKTGATKRGVLYELEVVTGGTFYLELTVRNFQLWQLGLLGFVLRDLDDGMVRVGSGKSRGLGRMSARVEDVLVQTVRRDGAATLRGVAALASNLGEYDLAAGDEAGMPDGLRPAPDESPFYDTYLAKGADQALALFRACASSPWQKARTHLAERQGG